METLLVSLVRAVHVNETFLALKHFEKVIKSYHFCYHRALLHYIKVTGAGTIRFCHDPIDIVLICIELFHRQELRVQYISRHLGTMRFVLQNSIAS